MSQQFRQESMAMGILLGVLMQLVAAQTQASYARQHPSPHISSSRQTSLASRAIHYFGGKKPHIVVIPSELVPYLSQETFPHGQNGKVTRQTPYGPVQIHWHVNEGTEDGSIIPHPDELHQYSTITHFAIISPVNLPVIADIEVSEESRRPWTWLHINGMILAYYPPGDTDKHRHFRLVKLQGGLNIIQAGLHDAE